MLEYFKDTMKLTFSPASPFARKVRIAAIELGLIDKIELVADHGRAGPAQRRIFARSRR